MNDITTPQHIRKLLATYQKNADLIKIGAYVEGSDKTVGKAISLIAEINAFLTQSVTEKCSYETTVSELIQIVSL